MTIIVDVPAVHTLYPVSKSIRAFAEICSKYSSGSLIFCPSFFQSWSNYAWVSYQYMMNGRQLIESYQVGKITTEQFLKNLATVFCFLERFRPSPDDWEALHSQKPYAENFINSLLEDAWNATIGMDDTRKRRFAALMTLNEPIYFIANTNELNALKFVELLQHHNPELSLHFPIDLSVPEIPDRMPVEVAPNIYFCPSHRYKLLKTLGENLNQDPDSTQSLLSHLIMENLQDRADISIVSQYEEDLLEAVHLGVNPDRTFLADTFFNAIPVAERKFS